MIELRHSTLQFTDEGAISFFHDGTSYGALPHNRPHYWVASHRMGYGDDILTYCREHELAHLVIEEELHDRPSRIIWGLAHDRPLGPSQAAYEEMGAMALQRFARASERPLIGPGIDWDAIKMRFLKLLA